MPVNYGHDEDNVDYDEAQYHSRRDENDQQLANYVLEDPEPGVSMVQGISEQSSHVRKLDREISSGGPAHDDAANEGPGDGQQNNDDVHSDVPDI